MPIERKRRVFVVNEPNISRAGTTYDVSRAKRWGEISFVFTRDQPLPYVDPLFAQRRAQDVMGAMTSDDFLVWAGGDPLGLVIAAAIAYSATGQFVGYLSWNKYRGEYVPVYLMNLPTEQRA